MDCEAVREHLQEELEGRSLPPGAREHLAACGDCAGRRESLAAVHATLAAEPALAWSGARTEEVILRIRNERRRSRVGAAAVAASLVPVAWLGARVLGDLGVAGAAGSAARRLGLPTGTGEALDRIGDGAAALATDLASALDRVAFGGSLPVAIAALAAVFVLNGIVVGRLRLARGRES